MKILVVGSGGREHALAWKLAQSPRVQVVYVAPGNGGTALEPNLENIAITGINELADFAVKEHIHLTVVGPEGPLAGGIVDTFRARGLKIFGPTKAAAQLESSKDFAKAFMQRHGIPTAAYQTFGDAAAAHAYLDKQGAPIVVKADGLAAGKGVVVAMSLDDAHAAVDMMLTDNKMGDAGARVVIEEFLTGEEASFIVMVDGQHVLPLATSQDHKRLLDADQGPNTGGMGAYSPAPVVTPQIHAEVMRRIIMPTVQGMAKDGIEFTGFLYAGLMIDANGHAKTLEFNCRMGDPEAQPIMLRLKTDLLDLFEHAVAGTLDAIEADWDHRAALGVVMAAHNYPDTPRKGDPISGLPPPPLAQPQTDAEIDAVVFHAGTVKDGKAIKTAGGRVLCVTALGSSVKIAQRRAYELLEPIRFDGMQYRTDIGYRAMAQRGEHKVPADAGHGTGHSTGHSTGHAAGSSAGHSASPATAPAKRMKQFESLAAWLAYIESLHPQTIAMGLERVRTVAQRLDIRFTCPVITVAGTNGKGSTCVMLEAMLRASSYHTGLYTSPHLIDFNERIRVNGANVGDATLTAAFEQVEAARVSGDEVQLTYFEFTTLAALLIFRDAQLDCVILEVGLGGRLDAVNIIDADVSILTSVDLDHQSYLGDTREKIGWEKAHVFRAGRPAIVSEPQPPQSVIELSAALGARLLRIGHEFGYAGDKQQWKFWYRADAAAEPVTRNGLPYPALRGVNQLLNASAALAALETLRERLPLPVQALKRGLLEVEWPGRFQMLPGQPMVILDVAHNPQAAGVMAENLSNIGYAPYTHAVFGMLADKDVAGVVKLLDGKIDFWHLASLPGPRGLSADALADIIARAGVKGERVLHDGPAGAYAAARKRAGEGDRILVFGSFLTVAEVMQVLKMK